jgi:hypothetical protein
MMDDFDFRAALDEHNLVVDEGNVIGGPFIPDGRYRLYVIDTHDVICEAKTHTDLIEEFESWLSFRRS